MLHKGCLIDASLCELGLLLDAGADRCINLKNNHGETALHLYLMHTEPGAFNVRVLDRLLDAGADTSIPNSRGKKARQILEARVGDEKDVLIQRLLRHEGHEAQEDPHGQETGQSPGLQAS